MEIITTGQSEQWLDVLSRSSGYDFCHLPGYHRVAEQCGEGEAKLFVYRSKDYTVAIPLLLRPLNSVPGLGDLAADWKDATSVYGYSGPVISGSDLPDGVRMDFQKALGNALCRECVVSVFSRFHPLFPQRHIVAGLGACVSSGDTVSIDLTLPEADQCAKYRRDLRNGIRQLRNAGIVCVHDAKMERLPSFVRMYRETMGRVGAEDWYFFKGRYFEELLAQIGTHLHLFVCSQGDVDIGAVLVTSCGGIAQTYLSATANDYTRLAPTKLLFESVRAWAVGQGLKALHFGGGVGGRCDSLFHFKSGFSDRRHDFLTWRWIMEPDFYQKLCLEKAKQNERAGLTPVSSDYFPEYRCRSVPAESGKGGDSQ